MLWVAGRGAVPNICLMVYAPHRTGLSFLRVQPARVGPGERTSVRVQVQNLGAEVSRNVTVALADAGERSSSGIVMRNLGDMAVCAIRETELSLGYAITDSLRLASLTVAVFPRERPIDVDTGLPSGSLGATSRTTI